MFRPYVRLLRAPGAALPVLASFVGALPIGMLGLGVLMLVQTATGSFAQAGLVSGALTAGNAVGLFVQGRLLDRFGQPRVLVPTGLLCSLSLVLLVIACARSLPLAVLAVLAGCSGLCIPAVISCMRVLWSSLVSDPAGRDAAYAMLSMKFQIAMIVGPLLVSALLVVSRPAVAVLVAGGLAGGAGVIFALTPASRRWRPDARGVPRRRRGRAGLASGGIATAGMVTLLVGGFCSGVAAGVIVVGVPAVAVAHSSAALTGVLLAALSAGELVGGLLYGGRSWRAGRVVRLFAAQAAGALALVLAALVSGAPYALLAVLAAVGLVTTPAAIASSALLDDVAPAGALTRAYTSLVAASLVGAAAGNALGGLVSSALAPWATFLLAALALAAVASWTFTRRGSLSRAPSDS